MIKILFFIEELTAGGAEKVLCNLVNHMDQSKFDITVHTLYKCNAIGKLNGGIKYRYVYDERSAWSRLKCRIEAELGIIYKKYIRDNYDIEVAYLECGSTKIMASSTNQKALKLAWIHCDLEKKISDMNMFVQKTSKHYCKYDKVVCVSRQCQETYQKYFNDNPTSIVLHNFIDKKEILEKAKESLDNSFDQDVFTFVAMGRLTKQKNFSKLLVVHERLLKEGLDHNLWIIGEGPEKDELVQYTKEHQLIQKTKFWGFQDNPYHIMCKGDAFVCSSVYEGYSTAVFEALILGIAVVTTDCTGMREILGNSKYGLITDMSEEGLFLGMKKLLQDKKIYQYYKEQSYKRGIELCKNNSVHTIENTLMDLLKEKNN